MACNQVLQKESLSSTILRVFQTFTRLGGKKRFQNPFLIKFTVYCLVTLLKMEDSSSVYSGPNHHPFGKCACLFDKTPIKPIFFISFPYKLDSLVCCKKSALICKHISFPLLNSSFFMHGGKNKSFFFICGG